MRGKLIVIEGGDGSGKTTQLMLLDQGLRKAGYAVENMHFPKHESQFGKVVDAYLRGELGKKEDLPSEFIAMLYMSDFYDSKKYMEELLEKGTIILLSRYFSSTLSFQVALEKKEKEFVWNWIRLVASRLPQPDLVIVLDVPINISKKFLDNINRAETYKRGEKKDQHETDLVFQQAVREEYERNIKRLYWTRVKCYEKGEMLSIDKIHALVWKETMDTITGGKKLNGFFQ